LYRHQFLLDAGDFAAIQAGFLSERQVGAYENENQGKPAHFIFLRAG
jgi:hypothetical protein